LLITRAQKKRGAAVAVAAKKSFIAVYAVGYSLTVLWHDLFVCRLLAGSECL